MASCEAYNFQARIARGLTQAPDLQQFHALLTTGASSSSCQPGYICAANSSCLPCPHGSFCPSGSRQGSSCPWVAECPSGADYPSFSGSRGFAYAVILLVLLLCHLGFCFWMQKQRHELARAQLAVTQPSSLHSRLNLLQANDGFSRSIQPVALPHPVDVQAWQRFDSRQGDPAPAAADAEFIHGHLHAILKKTEREENSLSGALWHLARPSQNKRAFPGQLCLNSEPFVPNEHGRFIGVVHQDAALQRSLTLREAVEMQLHQAKPSLDARQQREAAGHLLELLGLLPIQSVLVRDVQSSGTAAVMILVSLAITLAARPAVLLLPQLPTAMSADERLALLYFLSKLAAATNINIIVMHGSMSEEEIQACWTVRHEWDMFQMPMAAHGLHQEDVPHSSPAAPGDESALLGSVQQWLLQASGNDENHTALAQPASIPAGFPDDQDILPAFFLPDQVSESGGSTIVTQHNPLFGTSQLSSPRKAVPLQPALRTPSEEEVASAASSITGLTGRRRISAGSLVIPGPALRLYGDGRASPVSNDGVGDTSSVLLTEGELSATSSISTINSFAAFHHLIQPQKSPLSDGPHSPSHTLSTASGGSQLSDKQKLVAFAAVQGAPISPAGLPHDAWNDAEPLGTLPLGLADASQLDQEAPRGRRRPFTLPSRQQLAQSGLASRASDVPDEASSFSASQRSTRPSVGPAASASNPIFGGDRPQGRVTVHENMAAWLAADSAASSPDISPQPSLSVPLLRTSVVLQQHASAHVSHSSPAASSSHVAQQSDTSKEPQGEGVLPYWHESSGQGSAASPSSGMRSPFSSSPFSMSPDLLARTQPVDVSWDSQAPDISSVRILHAAYPAESTAAAASCEENGHAPEGSAASALSHSRFPAVNAGIPFRGAVRGNFSFSLATQRSIPSITQLTPPSTSNLQPSQHAATPSRDPNCGMTISHEHPAISRTRKAPLLTAASLESNASGIMLVSNPLAHRSAAGGADIFLNPLISHRSHLAATPSQELPRMVSEELHSHPLAELPEGSDILLELSAPSSVMSSQHLPSHSTSHPSPLGPFGAAVPPAPSRLAAQQESAALPAAETSNPARNTDDGSVLAQRLPAIQQDASSLHAPESSSSIRDTHNGSNMHQDGHESTPMQQPGLGFGQRRPVAEAAEGMDLERAMLSFAHASSDNSSCSPSAPASSNHSFQQALRQQHLHLHRFWRPLRSRAGQQTSAGIQQQSSPIAAGVNSLAARQVQELQQQPEGTTTGWQGLLQNWWPKTKPAHHPDPSGSTPESDAAIADPHQRSTHTDDATGVAVNDLAQDTEPLNRPAANTAFLNNSRLLQHSKASVPDITIEIPAPETLSTPHADNMTLPSNIGNTAADKSSFDTHATDMRHTQTDAKVKGVPFISRLLRLRRESPGQTGTRLMQPSAGPDPEVGHPAHTQEITEMLPRDTNLRGSLQLNQSPVRLRHLRGWLVAVGIGHHQPQQLHGNLEGPLLQHAHSGNAGSANNESEADPDAADTTGPGFYRAPLGLHQFASWARAATREPRPFPRPQHLPRADRPPIHPASSLILRQPRSCCSSGMLNAFRSSLSACSAWICCASHSRPLQPCEAISRSPLGQLQLAVQLVVIQVWRHPCGLIIGDICWTLLAGLVVGAAQGLSPDPSLKRLPADLAVAALALGLVTALASVSLLSPYRLPHVKLPEPAGYLAGCPRYPARSAMLVATLGWQGIAVAVRPALFFGVWAPLALKPAPFAHVYAGGVLTAFWTSAFGILAGLLAPLTVAICGILLTILILALPFSASIPAFDWTSSAGASYLSGSSFGRWCSELSSIAAMQGVDSEEQAALLVPSMARHGFCRLDRLSAALHSVALNPSQLVAIAQQLQAQPGELCNEFTQAGIASMVVQASVLILLVAFLMLRPL
ncbi:hypothetical protein WJX74_003615 [Apatococcus lobatus]|uniref:ABC transporter domain-containing protein n=1 Tax=Apatococcus lobatus TaxID=904363 RepID=A0AAW1RBN2_9CHLO